MTTSPVDFEWLLSDESHLAQGGCLTAIRGQISADAVISAFGLDASSEADPDDWDQSIAFVLVEGGAIVNEVNQFQGTRGDILRRLTGEDGVAASIFWGEDSDVTFTAQTGQERIISIDLADSIDDYPVLSSEVEAILRSGPHANSVLLGAAMVAAFTALPIRPETVLVDMPRYLPL